MALNYVQADILGLVDDQELLLFIVEVGEGTLPQRGMQGVSKQFKSLTCHFCFLPLY